MYVVKISSINIMIKIFFSIPEFFSIPDYPQYVI